MIEITIYKCEIYGAEFDDEYEANCHEFVCRYNEVKKLDGSRLRFYKEDGTEIKFDNPSYVWAEFDDIAAFTVGNDDDAMFVKELFAWRGYENPFNHWVRPADQIKKWVDIKNKFIKDT